MSVARQTFNGFTFPGGRDLVHGIRNGPVFVSNLDQPHRNLGSCVSSLQHIRSSARDGFFGSCADNDCLCCYGSETVDVGTNVDLHDVVIPQGL